MEVDLSDGVNTAEALTLHVRVLSDSNANQHQPLTTSLEVFNYKGTLKDQIIGYFYYSIVFITILVTRQCHYYAML